MARVVAMGGGHGLARALRALCEMGEEPTAVVTVADDGGSSGRLRRELGIIAPGDLRMALLALAGDTELAHLMGHRFRGGQLEGHALGNLLLVALAEQHGGFVPALEAAGRLLGCAGRALPSTTGSVELCAQVSGARVNGQAHITRANGRIERVWLEPGDPPPCTEAVAAIREATAVVLGPGSLFTSVIANLLVPGIRTALTETRAKIVYVANLRTQPGETGGLDVAAHVQAVTEHLPAGLDAVVVHDGPVPEEAGAVPLGTAIPAGLAEHVVRADLAERIDGHPRAAHDATELSKALEPLLSDRRMVRRDP